MVNQNNFIDELNKFAGTVQGDPKQQVQNLLNSGQMSQQTYARYQQVAQAFQNGNMLEAIATIFRR
jgi:TATA-box binding protein (TBP) (component of TFIID and TFIIIB)